MAMGCVLCDKHEGTAAVVVEDKRHGKREYWCCGVCRAALAISHNLGIPSIASKKLEEIDTAKYPPSTLIL